MSELESFREATKQLAVTALTSPVHTETNRSAKAILRLLSSSKSDYYSTRDSSILKYAAASLSGPEAKTDPELFAFLVSLARTVSGSRPESLNLTTAGDPSSDGGSLLVQLPECFWRLLDQVSETPSVCPLGRVEVENVEGLVHAIVTILHAHCLSDVAATKWVVKAFMRFLLSENMNIAVACRHAICFMYRRILKKQPTSASAAASKASASPKQGPGPSSSSGHRSNRPARRRPSRPQPRQAQAQLQPPLLPPPVPPEQQAAALMLLGDDDHQPMPAAQNPAAAAAAAMMVDEDPDADQDPDGVDQVYEMNADGDEEAMMELAIALSLQDQQAGAAQQVPNAAQASAPASSANYPSVSVQESIDGGHTSDTTGSGLSDEEGSMAAATTTTTEGGAGAGPSESRPTTITTTTADGSGSGSSQQTQSGEAKREDKETKLLLAFLDCLIDSLPQLDGLTGIRCISYLQVLMSLLNSLSCTQVEERKLAEKLLDGMMAGLDFTPQAASAFCQRSPESVVTLLKLRFITIILSRSKGRTKQQMTEADSFICSYTAEILLNRGILDYCLTVLKTLLVTAQPVDSASQSQKVLSVRPAGNPPDLAPFFLRPYVKEHCRDVFESYTQLVTEMVMRLPYQVKKVADLCWSSVPSPNFDAAWTPVLCEFLRSEKSSFVKKHIRKLFMFICGSKDKYRQMRDVHSLEFDLKFVQSMCGVSSAANDPQTGGRHVTPDYGTLNIVMDHLKSCCDIALNRTPNWQKFCVANPGMFCYLLELALIVDDNVADTILSLLNAAVSIPESGKEGKKI